MNAAQGVDDHTHGGAAMPDAFEAMTAGADDQRSRLTATGPETHRRDIIAQRHQSVDQVVEVLNFCDGLQSAHGHADALSHDAHLADAGVEYPLRPMLGLQSRESLVHITDATQVLSKGEYPGIMREQGIEISVQHLITVDHG